METKTRTKIPTIHHCACGKSFDTHGKLMTHQYSAHGTVNSIRAITTTNVCPLCKAEFKNVKQAKDHAQLICAPKATQTMLTQIIQEHEARKQQAETKTKKKSRIPEITSNQLTISNAVHRANKTAPKNTEAPQTPNNQANNSNANQFNSSSVIPG